MNIKTKIVTVFTLAVLIVPGISLAQTMSTAQLEAEIVALTAKLQSLETQLAAQGGSANAWCYTFSLNLSIGMSGAGVTALQTALQKDGESVTVNGTFDDQTASAVTAFQEKYQSSILAPSGLSYGTGYAGKATRAELNSLFGCTGGGSPITPPIIVNPIVPPVATSTPPIVCPVWGCNGPEPIVPPIIISTSSSASQPHISSVVSIDQGTGSDTDVTMMGSGFGSSPTISISGNGYPTTIVKPASVEQEGGTSMRIDFLFPLNITNSTSSYSVEVINNGVASNAVNISPNPSPAG